MGFQNSIYNACHGFGTLVIWLLKRFGNVVEGGCKKSASITSMDFLKFFLQFNCYLFIPISLYIFIVIVFCIF